MNATKRFGTLATVVTLALAAVFVSCNRMDDDSGTGSLRVSASSDPTVIDIDSHAAGTRAANLDTKTYHLTLKSGAPSCFSISHF